MGELTDAKDHLNSIIVSFKQNLRVINKMVNKYERWENKNGVLRKVKVKQTKGDSWAIRKPLHKDTIYGLIKLRSKRFVSISNAIDNVDDIVEVNIRNIIRELIHKGYNKNTITSKLKEIDKGVMKVEIYYWNDENVASRVQLDQSFNESKIQSITDSGVQKILLKHLSQNKYQNVKDDKGRLILPELLAFSTDGIEEMNLKIRELNNGLNHQPIYKIRTFEPRGNKFNIGNIGNKKYKFAEAAKGTNLFFAIYLDKTGRRTYKTIPFNEVVESQKQSASDIIKCQSVPLVDDNGNTLLFQLSPNDLVYLPTEDEFENTLNINFQKFTYQQFQRV
ncbi:MAG: hypothetical protein MH132_08800 [Hydrotalea sp.]|nr:hypothetical protein [Hydrotalea sp.]